MMDRLTDKLDGLDRRYDKLAEEMGQPGVAADYEKVQALAKERSSLERVVGLYRDYKKTSAGIEDTRSLLQAESDSEMAALAR